LSTVTPEPRACSAASSSAMPLPIAPQPPRRNVGRTRRSGSAGPGSSAPQVYVKAENRRLSSSAPRSDFTAATRLNTSATPRFAATRAPIGLRTEHTPLSDVLPDETRASQPFELITVHESSGRALVPTERIAA